MLMAKLVVSGAVRSQDELCERILVSDERPSKSSVSMHMRVATTIPERLLRAMREHEITSGHPHGLCHQRTVQGKAV